MVKVLKTFRNDWSAYWNRLFFFAHYLYASRIERLHPMNCGFWTRRYRKDRRSGCAREGILPFWWQQCGSVFGRLWGIVKLFFQLEEVWLQSRPRSRVEDALQELIGTTRQEITDWRTLKAQELVTMYWKLRQQMPEVEIPSVLRLWIRKHNPFVLSYTRAYARRIWQKWYRHIWNPVVWVEVWLFEWVNGVRFLTLLLVKGR